MSQARRVVEVFDLVRSLGYACALVGGLAVSLRSRERLTVDIHFAVSVKSDADAEALVFAMRRNDFVLKHVIEQKAKGVLGTVRFQHPEDEIEEPSVDLLVGSCGIEREIVLDAEALEFGTGRTISVARLPHLVAMKTLSEQDDRLQDRLDLVALLCRASSDEVEEARRLVRLIEDRGFHRGKDMQAELRRFVEKANDTSLDMGDDLLS